jgi:hypothetical protein
MIRDKELWEKIKNLTGTDKELKRLNDINAEGKLLADEYWTIKARWAANKKRARDEGTPP